MTPEHQQAEREAPCGCCGMPCRPNEYHPYAACLMFKACSDSDTVRANLRGVLDHGAGRADVVPPGMALVPIEPTDAMWDAAVREENRVFRLWPGQHPSCFQIWKAMVAASQDPCPPCKLGIDGKLSERCIAKCKKEGAKG